MKFGACTESDSNLSSNRVSEGEGADELGYHEVCKRGSADEAGCSVDSAKILDNDVREPKVDEGMTECTEGGKESSSCSSG